MMFPYNLPWVVGPVPIIATVWSAYTYGRVVALRTGIVGNGFLAAMLLPLGIYSLGAQLFFSYFNLYYLLIANQILTAISCFALLKFADHIRSDGFKRPRKESSIAHCLKLIAMFGSIVLLMDVLLLLIPLQSACGVAKCFAMEVIVGKKDGYFGLIYLGGLIACVFLLVVIVSLSEIFRKLWQSNI